MAKTNTPFLSLGSRGTVGESLTSQKGSSSTILRSKPAPTDRYTLGQAYQRWLYEDYAYLWRQQSAIIQAQYRSAGVRYHLTGFQYWMKDMLTRLPDIAAWYKLDDNLGAITIDSSKNNNPGTIIGASPATGIIAGALSFDGLNDTVTTPYTPACDNGLNPFTTTIFLRTPATAAWSQAFSRFQNANNRWYLHFNAAFIPRIWARIGGVDQGALTGTTAIDDNLPHVLTITHVPNALQTLYFDGQWNAQRAIPNISWDVTAGYQLGAQVAAAFFAGILDNFIVHNRLLDTTEIARWAARRYPP